MAGMTHLLNEVGHGETLVQKTKLSSLGLLVLGVAKDSSVQQCSVDIGDHGANVTSAVGLARGGELDRVEVLGHGPSDGRVSSALERRKDREGSLVEVESVTLVERVDFSTRGDANVGVGKDELSNSLQTARRVSSRPPDLAMLAETYVVEGVAVDSTAGRDDKVGGRSVHAVTAKRKCQDALERGDRTWTTHPAATISFPGRRTSET
jgi:hypothetical protein